jgi:hypothetical protein
MRSALGGAEGHLTKPCTIKALWGPERKKNQKSNKIQTGREIRKKNNLCFDRRYEFRVKECGPNWGNWFKRIGFDLKGGQLDDVVLMRTFVGFEHEGKWFSRCSTVDCLRELP